MTHLQRALDGNAKKAVGGLLTHGHFYREALKEQEEQSGNEESVAGAYLKAVFDHPRVSEDNFTQLRSLYNTLHVTISMILLPRTTRRAVQKLPDTLKTRWGEERVEMLPKMTTLLYLDEWLRARVRAKSIISDQSLNSRSPKSTTRQTNGRRNGHNRAATADSIEVSCHS